MRSSAVINNLQYELAHERIGAARRAAEQGCDAGRLASAARWRRIEQALAAAHERVTRSAEAAEELSHRNG
jgi:hypothetical protein